MKLLPGSAVRNLCRFLLGEDSTAMWDVLIYSPKHDSRFLCLELTALLVRCQALLNPTSPLVAFET